MVTKLQGCVNNMNRKVFSQLKNLLFVEIVCKSHDESCNCHDGK